MRNSANRVVLNTSVLYMRMVITMLVTLYSTRLVLNALGVIDYGIYNLTAGVIAMLSFLNVAMTVSTQRYMSFNLAAADKTKLKSVFNSSILLHLIIGLIVVCLFEVLGLFLFDHVLNIPAERTGTAKTIYQFMVITSFFTIISVPYDAVINAHENMIAVAVFGIAEAIVKLIIAISIVHVDFDRLIYYGASLALLSLSILGIKRAYCYSKYKDLRINFRKYGDKKLFKEILSYSGWNMVGASVVIGNAQGMAILLNVFFGAIINAAYAIATQINAQMNLFSVTMLQALNPQIVKSESAGDRKRMLSLSMAACKFSFFLISFFAIPVLFEMHFILEIWLDKVPDYTVNFARIIIITTLVSQLSIGLQTSIHSIGKIKGYTIGMTIILSLLLPLSFVLLKLGLSPYIVLLSNIFFECVALSFRVYTVHKLAGLPIGTYLYNVILRSLLTVLVVCCISFIPFLLMEDNLYRFLLLLILHVAIMILSVLTVGVSKEEWGKISGIFSAFTNKIFKRQWLAN